MNETLQLTFQLSNGKTMSISVVLPKVTVSDAEVRSVMQAIVAQQIFAKDGAVVVAPKSAKRITRQVDEYEVI